MNFDLGRPFTLFSGEPLNYVNADYVVASVDIERQYVDWVIPIEDREVRIVSMCRTPDEFILVGWRYEAKADGGRTTVPTALRVQDDGQAIEVLGKPKLRGEALYQSTTVHDGHVLASGLVRHGKETVPFVARYSGLYEEPEVVLCKGADVAHITGMSATDSGVLLYGCANDKKLLNAGGVDLTMAEPDGDAQFGFVIRVFMAQFDPKSTILLGGGFLDTVAAATERDGEVNVLMSTFQSSSSEWNLSGRHRHVPTIYNLRVEDGRLIGSKRLWFSNPNLHTIGLPILARGGSVALGIGCLDSNDSEYTLLLASDLGMSEMTRACGRSRRRRGERAQEPNDVEPTASFRADLRSALPLCLELGACGPSDSDQAPGNLIGRSSAPPFGLPSAVRRAAHHRRAQRPAGTSPPVIVPTRAALELRTDLVRIVPTFLRRTPRRRT
ncbi:MAG: hypothetical protein IT459_18215 [Planctomycetes bacterium]|nr:hypothetical protein [Planctomycetota bacterium]